MKLNTFFHTALLHLFYFSHYQYEETTRKKTYFYFSYLILFTGLAFMLGSWLNYGLRFDFQFIVSHAVVLMLSLLFYWGGLFFVFNKLIAYYAFENSPQANRHLMIYASTPFFAGNILGNIISPDSYFFINFVFSFLSAYYFEAGLTKNNDLALSIRIGLSVLLYIFLIVSYFFLNFILVSLN